MMIYELIKKAIAQKNEFMTEDLLKLQIEFFHTAGKITDEEKTELLDMFATPTQNQVPITPDTEQPQA